MNAKKLFKVIADVLKPGELLKLDVNVGYEANLISVKDRCAIVLKWFLDIHGDKDFDEVEYSEKYFQYNSYVNEHKIVTSIFQQN